MSLTITYPNKSVIAQVSEVAQLADYGGELLARTTLSKECFERGLEVFKRFPEAHNFPCAIRIGPIGRQERTTHAWDFNVT